MWKVLLSTYYFWLHNKDTNLPPYRYGVGDPGARRTEIMNSWKQRTRKVWRNTKSIRAWCRHLLTFWPQTLKTCPQASNGEFDSTRCFMFHILDCWRSCPFSRPFEIDRDAKMYTQVSWGPGNSISWIWGFGLGLVRVRLFLWVRDTQFSQSNPKLHPGWMNV